MASEDEETGTTSDALPLGRSILRGTRVDRYELGERIGRGGMGEVVAAREMSRV